MDFLFSAVSLFSLMPLTAEEERDFRYLLVGASKSGALRSVVKCHLEELRRKEVFSAALEIGSDVCIKKKAYNRKGKVKDNNSGIALF